MILKSVYTITIILFMNVESEIILSIGWSCISEYIKGANNTGATPIGKSRRRLNNKSFLMSSLIPRKKYIDYIYISLNKY